MWNELLKFLVAGKAAESPPVLRHQEEKQTVFGSVPKPSHAPYLAAVPLSRISLRITVTRLGLLFTLDQPNSFCLLMIFQGSHSPNFSPLSHCIVSVARFSCSRYSFVSSLCPTRSCTLRVRSTFFLLAVSFCPELLAIILFSQSSWYAQALYLRRFLAFHLRFLGPLVLQPEQQLLVLFLGFLCSSFAR